MKSHADGFLVAESLCRRYGSTTAVDHVGVEVFKGEFFSLLGPSGCGKSTTLRLIAGLEEPDAGEIRLNGEIIASAEKGIFTPAEKRNIGLVFQSYAVWPHMTVAENVSYPLEVRRWSKGDTEKRVRQVLELVGLAGLAERRPTQLSGGQQQRLARARSLVYKPDLLLLDEPLSNVDARLREQLRIELKRLQESLGVTIVYVTHDQAEAMSLSHRLAVMNVGRLEQIGEPEEIYKNPKSFFVQNFVGRLITFDRRTTLRDGRKCVTLTEGSILPISNEEPIALDRQVCIAVRLEDVEIAGVELASGTGHIEATVQQVSYVGGEYECLVVGGGREFVLKMPPARKLGKGQSVNLRFKEVKLWPR